MENVKSLLMSVFEQEKITIKDGVEFMSYIGPIIIASFLFLTSLSNGDVKAFIWMAFALAGMILVKVSKPLFTHLNVEDKEKKCKIKTLGGDTPSTSAFFFMFTISYMFFPMMVNKSYNIYILSGLLVFYGVDAVVKIKNSCTGYMGVALGTLFGAMWGGGMYAVLHPGGEKYTYFSIGSSNNTYCSKPSNQTFKCNVYKNGQIISSL